jgi:hypothetical protein
MWFFTYFRMAQGFWHSAVATIIPIIAYGTINSSYFLDSSGPYQDSSLVILGSIVYTAVIIICLLKIGFLESHNWTWLTFGAGIITIANWWIYQGVYGVLWPNLGDFGYDSVGIYEGLGNVQATLWAVVLLTIGIGLVLSDGVLVGIKAMWSPWNWFMVELRDRPLNRSDFGGWLKGAERVAGEFEGEWKHAGRWWQMWEGSNESKGVLERGESKRVEESVEVETIKEA